MAGGVSNPLGLVVLAFLQERPMHPYELGRLLKARNKQESIKYRHASLYMVVKQLLRDGYIEPQETSRAGQLPERTVYALTPSGQEELTRQMRELVAVPAKEYPRFEAALALIVVLPPDDVAVLLGDRLEALERRIAELRERVRPSPDVEWVHKIEYEYELALAEAEQRYVARLRAQVASGDVGTLWSGLHPR
ncbi:PadR family transcriptional regulator [Kribbella sp. HUAS MG21]|uniref:PadR family transcriptional regulator n=1 Tax=Kribbella sp. HUAS MG21 TaxID=3160966 RepID=A0AAU7TPP3_9ACTN